MGRENWFLGLIILKGRVIGLTTIEMFVMKDLMERTENQKWTHLLLCIFSVMYGEAMLHFYKNFKALDDYKVSSKIKGEGLVLDAKMLGHILNMSVDEFYTYMRRKWHSLEKKRMLYP